MTTACIRRKTNAPRQNATSPANEELLRRIAAGDRVAFGALYDRFSTRLYGLLLQILGDHDDAEDSLQVTFLQIWKQAGNYDSNRSKPDAWLLLLARSRAIDCQRQAERCPKYVDPTELIDDLAPIDPLLRLEISDGVRKALQLLPNDQATPIRMAFFDGHTHDHIAASLSIPVGTVKSRIRRGMDHLEYLLNPLRSHRI